MNSKKRSCATQSWTLMNSLVYYSQTWPCFDFENLLYCGFCHRPRAGFLLLSGIKTKILWSESIFKSSQCQV